MARNRLPTQKAQVSGATLKNPGRYTGRRQVPGSSPLGEPYQAMTKYQKSAWCELRDNLPWLNSSHRQLVRLACRLIAQMDEDPENGLGVAAAHALSSILSKLGATPVDESRISHQDDDETDPSDAFFGRPN